MSLPTLRCALAVTVAVWLRSVPKLVVAFCVSLSRWVVSGSRLPWLTRFSRSPRFRLNGSRLDFGECSPAVPSQPEVCDAGEGGADSSVDSVSAVWVAFFALDCCGLGLSA